MDTNTFPPGYTFHYTNVEEVLKDLNANFRTVSLEKYKEYTIKSTARAACQRYLKNYHRPKLSKGVLDKIRDHMIAELRKGYGEWMNIYDFDADGTFITNFETAYKTEWGRLYGNYPGTIHDHVFYTAHAFEKFKERIGEGRFNLLTLAFKRTRNTTPTAADIFKFCLLNAGVFLELGRFIYANIGPGVAILEKFPKGILVVKTFLEPWMEYPRDNWFYTNTSGMFLDRTDVGIEYCKQYQKKEPVIGKLRFFDSDNVPYGEYVRMMTLQKSSGVIDF